MKIFNQKTVIGLFDRDKDVEEVVSKLQKQGFGEENEDEIHVFDQHRLPQEAPEQQTLTQKPGQVPLPGMAGVMITSDKNSGTENALNQRAIQNMLTGLGLNDEEANFHAMHVVRGNSLVIVDTTKERAAEAAEIMEQVSAAVSEA